MRDALGRPIHDLRISVTDRCNFRCTYCMPREVYGRDYAFLPRAELLTFEEIERLARVFVALGVRKMRLTGGEPLLRRDLPTARGDARRRSMDVDDITLTTNGSLLDAPGAGARLDAGLSRISVSLDSLDEQTFAAMNDVGFPVSSVLDGIAAAQAAGLQPIKVNMVVRRGLNERTSCRWRATSASAATSCASSSTWTSVTPTAGGSTTSSRPSEIVAAIDAEMPLVAVPPTYPGEVADRWAYATASGEVGVIASVTQPFCRDCSRARLTADGQLYTCLFASSGHDLRAPVASRRNGRRARPTDRTGVERAHGSLLGAALTRDDTSAAGAHARSRPRRDVTNRRLMGPFGP